MVPHEVSPIADRRCRVASGHESCAVSGVHVTLPIADSDIASAEIKMPFECIFHVVAICDLAIALSQ